MNKVTKDFRILLVYPDLPGSLVVPLSIGIFTWILRKEGFLVDLFDTAVYKDSINSDSHAENKAKFLHARKAFSTGEIKLKSFDSMSFDFIEKIESFKPDFIIYSFTESAFPRALYLLRISNKYNKPTLVGGVLVTADPEWVISFPEISLLGLGEGEEVVKEVSLKLYDNEDISNVQNLWIKKDGKIIRNPIRPYVNLDDYSTDFSLFDKSRFMRPMGGKLFRCLPIETYRGCPNNCSYCNSSMHNQIAKKYNRVFLRRRTIESTRNELRHLKEDYNPELIYFIDDSFLARPKEEIEQFIEMYKEFRIPFWFNSRPEDCTLDILYKLKEVGLFRAAFGVQAGNEKLAMSIGRRINNEKLLYYLDIIYKSGIVFNVDFIIGFPHDTRETIFDSIRLAKKIKGCDAITTNIFTPYRGTRCREDAIKAGYLDPSLFVTHFTGGSLLNIPHLTSNQLIGLQRTFPLYVEFDESEWSEIEKAEQLDEECNKIFEYYAGLYRKRKWGE